MSVIRLLAEEVEKEEGISITVKLGSGEGNEYAGLKSLVFRQFIIAIIPSQIAV
jgi:hypothetical protein